MANIIKDAFSEAVLMDNMEYMSRFPDKFFELACVDPPYGIGADRGVDRKSVAQFQHIEMGWDSKPPPKEYFDELIRVSQNQIVWGGNYFLEHLGNARCMIGWDKLNPDRLFADFELAWTSFDEVARLYKDKRVQELNKLDGGKIHPTQKPTRLYLWLFKRYAKAGFKILDTHLGSGKSRIAAHSLGLDFYGCDHSPQFYKDQEEGWRQYKESLSLFLPAEKKIQQNQSLSFFDLEGNI